MQLSRKKIIQEFRWSYATKHNVGISYLCPIVGNLSIIQTPMSLVYCKSNSELEVLIHEDENKIDKKTFFDV